MIYVNAAAMSMPLLQIHFKVPQKWVKKSESKDFMNF